MQSRSDGPTGTECRIVGLLASDGDRADSVTTRVPALLRRMVAELLGGSASSAVARDMESVSADAAAGVDHRTVKIAAALSGIPVLRVTRQGTILAFSGLPEDANVGYNVADHVNVADRPALLVALSRAADVPSHVMIRLRDGAIGAGGEARLRMVADGGSVLVSLAVVQAGAGTVPFDVAACAHDMRSPLAAIASLADHMASRQGTTDQAPGLIAAAARDALAMADGLLGHHAPSVADAKEIAPLGEVITAVLANQKPIADQVKATIFTRLGRDTCDVMVERDAGLRMIGNLVGNALAHGGEGVSVEITARLSGASVNVTVCDNGIGMPADIAARLEQGEVAPLGGARGHGLGLAIVARLAARDGGCATVSATRGGGTTITVPLMRIDPAAMADLNNGERDAPFRRLA
jgi:signal transduction histidine kinase